MICNFSIKFISIFLWSAFLFPAEVMAGRSKGKSPADTDTSAVSRTAPKKEGTHYKELDIPFDELIRRFTEFPTPEQRPLKEIIEAAKVPLATWNSGKVSPTQKNQVRQASYDECLRMLDEYDQAQNLLYNIFAQVMQNRSEYVPILQKCAGLFDGIERLQNAIIRFVWDTIETTHPDDARPQGDLILDYFLHAAALVYSTAGGGLSGDDASRFNSKALNSFLMSMGDLSAEGFQDPVEIQREISLCKEIDFKGMSVLQTPEGLIHIFEDQIYDFKMRGYKGPVGLFKSPTPLGRLLKNLPEGRRHLSQFGFLTFLNFISGGTIRSAEDINLYTPWFLEGSKPVRKRYQFISPADSEREGFKDYLSMRKILCPTAVDSIQQIQDFFRQEEMALTVKGESVDVALKRAQPVWDDVMKAHHEYYQVIAMRADMSGDNFPKMRSEEVFRLFKEANFIATLMENFSGAQYVENFERLDGVRDKIVALVDEVGLAFPAPKEPEAGKGEARLPESFHFFEINENALSVTAESKERARMIEARSACKEAAKACKNHKKDKKKALSSKVEADFSGGEKAVDRDALKRAASSRKKIVTKFRKSLVGNEYYAEHQSRVDDILSVLQKTQSIHELDGNLTEDYGPGHNLEKLEGLNVWSVRVNEQYRVTFKVSVLDDGEQNNPLRVAELKLSKHYKGI
jgi:plasmid maintenance system killer protein